MPDSVCFALQREGAQGDRQRADQWEGTNFGGQTEDALRGGCSARGPALLQHRSTWYFPCHLPGCKSQRVHNSQRHHGDHKPVLSALWWEILERPRRFLATEVSGQQWQLCETRSLPAILYGLVSLFIKWESPVIWLFHLVGYFSCPHVLFLNHF